MLVLDVLVLDVLVLDVLDVLDDELPPPPAPAPLDELALPDERDVPSPPHAAWSAAASRADASRVERTIVFMGQTA